MTEQGQSAAPGDGPQEGLHNDDEPVGRVWSRREVLAFLSLAGGGLLAAACVPGLPVTAPAATAAPTGEPAPAPAGAATLAESAPTCIVTPQQTEGPYFVDERLDRADIRSDQATGAISDGALFTLVLHVSRATGGQCAPLEGAVVDIWHCDAAGVYSGVRDRSSSTVEQNFLRGYQTTDAAGRVEFTTIYPGWYPGRTVHIHFKVRGQDSGRNYEFTSQLYFDDQVSDEILAQPPYAARGERTTRNAGDGIFRNGGEQLLVTVIPEAGGYRGRFDIGLALG